MEDAIFGDTVRDSDFGESVDLDFDEAAKTGNVDAEVLVVEQGW